MLRLLAVLVVIPLGACGLFEEHKSRDGRAVYRIKPEAATSIVQVVGSVVQNEPIAPPEFRVEEVAKTAYSFEVTGQTPLRQSILTITTEEVSICLSANDCLRVVDNKAGGQITGEFNGFRFVLYSSSGARFFHSGRAQEQVFRLAPSIATQAILANVYVKNLDGNSFQVRLRADDYQEYDIDAIVVFNDQGDLVSCIARRIATGQRTVIKDIPPNT